MKKRIDEFKKALFGTFLGVLFLMVIIILISYAYRNKVQVSDKISEEIISENIIFIKDVN